MSAITVSIVSHGHGRLLDSLLQDLDRCESLRGAKVIVTMNLGEEPFQPRSHHHISVVMVRNAAPQGFGANHNAAFAHCDGRWFAVLNPDLRIPKDHDPFRELLERAERDDKLALAVPVVLNSRGGTEDSVRSNLTPASVFARRLAGPRAAPVRADAFRWFAGMCMLFRSTAFRAAGGFDDRYFLYCEDYDICARLHLSGHALAQVATARVIHDAQRDSHRSRKHLNWHLRSLLRVWTSLPFWKILLNVRPSGTVHR